MLSDKTIREINDQIQSDVRDLGSICSSDEDKSAALERIRVLTNILNPQPTREELIAELADAIIAKQQRSRTPDPASIVTDIFASFRR